MRCLFNSRCSKLDDKGHSNRNDVGKEDCMMHDPDIAELGLSPQYFVKKVYFDKKQPRSSKSESIEHSIGRKEAGTRILFKRPARDHPLSIETFLQRLVAEDVISFVESGCDKAAGQVRIT